jgi:hypothetical protein
MLESNLILYLLVIVIMQKKIAFLAVELFIEWRDVEISSS